ncbi:hypothetical protein WJX73_001612 [Symbiochloris irregularis]|uniref:Uncharacterized protein n=1 Tax=Symbiochloris irregularis TaxID=706552 RepID=A0AAW1NEJ4_9CHLO
MVNSKSNTPRKATGASAARSPRPSGPKTAEEDRFSAVKASVVNNGLGEPVWTAFQPPSGKSLKHAFEAQKTKENELAADKAEAVLHGRRHEPAPEYLAAIKRREDHEGHDHQVARGMARIRHTQLLKSSDQNPLVHENHHLEAPDEALAGTPYKSRGQGAARTRQHDLSSNSFNERPPSPRHKAQREFEQKHKDFFGADYVEPVSRRGKGESTRDANRDNLALKQMEDDIVRDYPHGLPARMLKEATAKGLQIGPLGHGCQFSVAGKSTGTLQHSDL